MAYHRPRTRAPFSPRFAIVLILLLVSAAAFAVDVHDEILQPARRLLGSRYCRGGMSERCFDCSGFVNFIYRPAGIDLPRISRDMAHAGRPVRRDQLQPGDLVFFATGYRRGVITHVAIYAGQDTIIHAISDGPNRGVTMTPLSARYWSSRYHSAVRVIPEPPRVAAGTPDSGSDRGSDRNTQTGGTSGQSPADSAAGDTSEVKQARDVQFAKGEYSGELVGGEPEGYGTLVFDNGDVYEGQFVDGEPSGSGTYRWADGETHQGQFQNGAPVGTGAPARETYLNAHDSPWDTWDGVVRGDFEAWMEEQDRAFQEFLESEQVPPGR